MSARDSIREMGPMETYSCLQITCKICMHGKLFSVETFLFSVLGETEYGIDLDSVDRRSNNVMYISVII